MKIPTVDFTDETLAIDDTHGDGDWGAGHFIFSVMRRYRTNVSNSVRP